MVKNRFEFKTGGSYGAWGVGMVPRFYKQGAPLVQYVENHLPKSEHQFTRLHRSHLFVEKERRMINPTAPSEPPVFKNEQHLNYTAPSEPPVCRKRTQDDKLHGSIGATCL